MVRRGTTNGKRGRKPAATVPAGEALLLNGTEGSPAPPQPTTPRLDDVACRNKSVFKGKLSHASPIVDPTNSQEKITVYFSALKSEEAPECIKQEEIISDEPTKSLALQRIFTKVKCSPEKTMAEGSPHRIVLSEELEKLEIPEICELKSTDETGKAATNLGLKESKVKASKAKRKLIVNQSLNQDASQNHKLTEYFGVRRSVRKPKTAILEEKQKHLEEAVQSGIEDGLQVHNFPGKGRGIVANRLFRRGEFVVEYSGDLIDLNEARAREKLYSADQNTGCYMYYFQHKNQSYCVDATAESDRLGRLVNHSRTSGNLIPKVIEIKDRPHLLLVARSDILPGEELLYDYGDRSRVSLKHHPWLAS